MSNFVFRRGVYSFHLVRDSEKNTTTIDATFEKTQQRQMDGLKYTTVHRLSWYQHISYALLDVQYVESEEHFKKLFEQYHNQWIGVREAVS